MAYGKSLAIALGLLATSVMAAQAQDTPPTPVEPLVVAIGGVLFISPAGEPFRSGNDMTVSMKAWFDQADTNHDGALSPEEFLADHMRAFSRFDVNGDGFIDGAEVNHYELDVVPEIVTGYDRTEDVRPIGPMGAASPKRPRFFIGRPPPELVGAARYSTLNESEPLTVADTDVDFRVSAAEWRAAAARRFALLDANGDGKITFDELRLPSLPWGSVELNSSKCPAGYVCDEKK